MGNTPEIVSKLQFLYHLEENKLELGESGGGLGGWSCGRCGNGAVRGAGGVELRGVWASLWGRGEGRTTSARPNHNKYDESKLDFQRLCGFRSVRAVFDMALTESRHKSILESEFSSIDFFPD